MLTYEALINEAKENGMPAGKMRGALREYLQVLILKELYRLPQGKKFYFTGGTYLRLAHRIKRFSEDLDFNAHALTRREFEEVLRKIAAALRKDGFSVVIEFAHWENIFVAELIFSDAEKAYGIVSKYSKKEGVVIKVEVNRPRWKIKSETFMVADFGQMYPVLCTHRGALFADKIDALIKKNRARHLFDIIFMLSHKYPVDDKILKVLGVKAPPFEAILTRIDGIAPSELKKQAEDLRPFLFDESEADLIINAKSIIPQLIEKYKQR